MEMGEVDDGSTIVEGSSSRNMGGISSPRSRWVDDVCPGFRFDPTDEELLVQFLGNKVSGHPLPFGMDEVIPTIPLYGPGGDGDPRTLFERLPSYCCIPHPLVQTPTELYVFTYWEHVNSGNRPLRSCGQGTWSFNFDDHIVDSRGSLIGHVSNLTYHLKKTEGGGGGKGPTTHWVMHEFHLPDPPQSSSQLPEVTTTTTSKKDRHGSTSQQPRRRGKLVLCRIRYHKSIDEGGCPRKRGRVEQHKRGRVGLVQHGYVHQQQPVLLVEELRSDGGDQQYSDVYQQQRVPSLEERHGGSGSDLPQETCSLQQHSSHGGSLLSHGSGSLDVHDLIMIELAGLDQEVVLHGQQQQLVPWVEDLDGVYCSDIPWETYCMQQHGSQDDSLRLDGSGSSEVQLPEDHPPHGRLLRPPPSEDSASTQPLELPESEPPLQEHPVFTGQQRPLDDVHTTASLGLQQDTTVFDGLGPPGHSSTSTPHDLWTEVDDYDSFLGIHSRLLRGREEGHLPEFIVQDGFLLCLDTA